MNRLSQRRARTRGGVRRAQGVRTRGRGRGLCQPQALGVRGHGGPATRGGSRPQAIDEMNVVMIEDLPIGVPLESPLHPKKRRTWCPSSEPSTSSPSAEGPVTKKEEGSPAFPPSPAMSVECGAGGSTGSPAGSSNVSSQLRTPKGSKTKFLVNYGSEPESEVSGDDDEDDDGICPVGPMIPRVLQAMLEIPEDADGPADPVQNPEATEEEQEILGAMYQPLGLYDFAWKSFPDSSIRPELRREIFSDSNVGPTSNFSDPYDSFIAIWDRQIMDNIVVETNRHAQDLARKQIDSNTLQPHSRINEWRDTCVSELYVYFAMILAMGIVVRSRLDEYWNVSNDVFVTPGFRALMSLRRFQLLSKCLHFSNTAAMSALNLSPSEAKLYKIQPILSHLNSKFQSLYNLDQNIALDESLLQWKGVLQINQFISNKKAKVGVKSYEICESKTGYLWRFEMHAHQTQAPQQSGIGQDPMSASTPSIVLRLIQGLENKGHTLWMDNYYNSPALARTLKSKGFDCVGTLRTNRQYVPEALTNLEKKNMRPGQITGFTSGDVDLMVWRDQNRVATISTYHGNAVSIVSGTPKPIMVSDYNVMMGGVDKKDQMLAMYPIERKRTKIWYKKLFRRLLNVSVLNAFILTRPSRPHRAFRMSLVKSLIDKHAEACVVIPPMPSRYVDARRHHLAEYPILSEKSRRPRRICTICKKRVSTYCAACEKAVCLSPCFVALHRYK